MRTLRHAAELLAAAHTAHGQLALASALGFDAVALDVNGDGRRRLGLPDEIDDVRVVRGSGALRALILTVPSASLRETFIRVASALRANTGHVLWMIVGAAKGSAEVGVACWPEDRGARVLTLIAHRERIAASDAQALCALASAQGGEDLLVHSRWCELLGREALSRRFYRTLEQRVRALADSLAGMNADDRAELALLYVSRLLFLSYLEAKGWLNGDHAFLVRHFDACMTRGGRFHQRVLLPLFFGTLNTRTRNRAATARKFGAIPFLNGGLFTKGALERRHSSARFSDEAIGALFGELLSAYRFTAREGAQGWSDLSIDPEMLGHAFESLMASRERRTSGAFYTPQALVVHVAERALVTSLGTNELSEAEILSALGGTPLPLGAAAALRQRLATFTVLDPACGSGAFLVHMLERLSALHRAAGDARGLAVIRRDVLARAIHGVDVNPTAVWLCELRLWLSVVIESDETRMSAVPPLPNLDCNVRVGDTLSGEAFTEPPSLVGPSAVLIRLRERYVRAAGPSKAPLRRMLLREERRRALATIDRELVRIHNVRRERISVQRAADLFGSRSRAGAAERAEMREQRLRASALRRERRRIADNGALPFSFPSHFGAAHARGGFDLVIGNPPWVRLHNIPASARAALRARYVVYRNAAWEPGATAGHASRGFSAQIDLASLFVERSLELASPGCCVALLLPAKLWRSLAGGGVRALLMTRAELRVLEDWSEAPSSFDAAVYPSVMIARRQTSSGASVAACVRRRTFDAKWTTPSSAIRLLTDDVASPWLLLAPPIRAAFDLVASRGVSLAESAFGRATLGVKCGCNDAFMVNATAIESGDVLVEHQGRRGAIERELVRPLLRGEGLTPWRIEPGRGAIVWTHTTPGVPLRALPPGAARWLNPWRRQLLNRTDLHGTTTWWMLFRTESADPSRTRVVWSDFGRVPRAAILPAGDLTVPLNSCYVVACDDRVDALALTTLLNSPLAAAWLNALAEPARGGWHRYLAWTMSRLPIPHDWSRAREILAPFAELALVGQHPSPEELLAGACRTFRLRRSDVEPLVSWCHAPTQS